MTLSQNDSGRAFEYGLAISLSNHLPAVLDNDLTISRAKTSFDRCNQKEQERIINAADKASRFLIKHDNRLTKHTYSVKLQSDQLGRLGDVRDIVIINNELKEEIGISAKHRHYAVKHSRLSENIDFGKVWFQVPCSKKYFLEVVPIFEELKERQNKNEKWRDITNKRQLYYIPILYAFKTEIERLFRAKSYEVVQNLIHYLIGKFDFYKIIKENGEVSITAFNINGSLKWGKQLPLPGRIIEIESKPNSETTLNMICDHGWQISFRIHNASTYVEPSLKFDIKLEGIPSGISRHQMSYGD